MKCQQFLTLNDTVILIPNGIHTPITKNCHTAISISSIDESFQKIELKIRDSNKHINYELSYFNTKNGFFF